LNELRVLLLIEQVEDKLLPLLRPHVGGLHLTRAEGVEFGEALFLTVEFGSVSLGLLFCEFPLLLERRLLPLGDCLLLLGCKGPDTFNACATNKWNQGTSSPTQAGHGCIGCSEPNFWDKPDGVYGMGTGFKTGEGSCGAPGLPSLPVI
jgi:hypothetical protein